MELGGYGVTSILPGHLEPQYCGVSFIMCSRRYMFGIRRIDCSCINYLGSPHPRVRRCMTVLINK